MSRGRVITSKNLCREPLPGLGGWVPSSSALGWTHTHEGLGLSSPGAVRSGVVISNVWVGALHGGEGKPGPWSEERMARTRMCGPPWLCCLPSSLQGCTGCSSAWSRPGRWSTASPITVARIPSAACWWLSQILPNRAYAICPSSVSSPGNVRC
jgi:hypothetical protein